MNKQIRLLSLCVFSMLLTGCCCPPTKPDPPSFPSERVYEVESSTGALQGIMPPGSEFTFVKNNTGPQYRIWIKQPGGMFRELSDCEAPVQNGMFDCNHCGAPLSFRIFETEMACNYATCVHIVADTATPVCPGGGNGTGGHN